MSRGPGRPVAVVLARGITRNVVVLGLVSLLTDVSSELLVHVVPLFLANVLAATPTLIGIVEGVAEAVAAFVKLGSGALSDRMGRRKVLVGTGYGISVLAKSLFLVATTWPLVLAARVGDRIGKGIRTAPRDALIADSTAPDLRGRAFGFHRAMDTAGATIGVGLAALIVGLSEGEAAQLDLATFRLLALAALLPGILAVAVIALALRDVRAAGRTRPPRAGIRAAAPTAAGSTAAVPEGTERRLGLRDLPRPLWLFVVATGLFTLGNSSDAFLAIRSQALGVTVRDLLLIVLVFNLVSALVAWPVGALSDRIGRRRLIALAWALYGGVYLGFALADVAAAVLPLWLLYGAYYGVNEAVGRALVADLAVPEARATAYGILNAVAGLAILPASVVAGLLWDRLGAPAPFWFGAGCAAAAIGLLGAVRVGPPPPGPAATG
jgi:MFS family permease